MYIALGPRCGDYARCDLWFRRHRVTRRSGNFGNITIGFLDIDLLYQSVFKTYVHSVGAEIRRICPGLFPGSSGSRVTGGSEAVGNSIVGFPDIDLIWQSVNRFALRALAAELWSKRPGSKMAPKGHRGPPGGRTSMRVALLNSPYMGLYPKPKPQSPLPRNILLHSL